MPEARILRSALEDLDEHHGRPESEIVIAGHAQCVGAGCGNRQDLAQLGARQPNVADQHITRFAVAPSNMNKLGGRRGGAVRQQRGIACPI